MKEKKIDAERAIQMIALREGKSVKYIRDHIKIAMLTGMCNPDPAVQERWKKIPCKGEVPTPEEVITYIATHVDAGINPFEL